MALGRGLSSLIPSQKIIKSLIGEEANEKVYQIPLRDIIPNREQPRRIFSHQDLEDLVSSIKKHGLLQPIVVTESPRGGYELIAGERRLRAAGIAGLATIPALVRKASDHERLELALIENIQRQNLNVIEEAHAFKRLVDQYGLTQDQVAEQVGKSRSAITNTIRLLGLPEVIQKAVMDGELSMGKARAILSLKDEREQIQMFQSMIGEHLTVRDIERSVADRGQASRKGSVRRDPNVMAQEKLLEERLGTKVTITQTGEKGKILIEFYSKEELHRLMQELG